MHLVPDARAVKAVTPEFTSTLTLLDERPISDADWATASFTFCAVLDRSVATRPPRSTA